jgi:acid phosphatase
MKKALNGVLFTIFLVGCSTASEFRLVNLSETKALVQNYYESGDFEKETGEIFLNAVAEIEKLNPVNNPAVVFDIDETALSNYEHTKEIGFGYVPSLWHDWIIQGDAKAIPQSLKFYNYLIGKNVAIIFITGRYEEAKKATYNNLINEGYTVFDTLIVREKNEMKIPAAEFKALKRKELTDKGYNIIACVGDQWSDMVGGYAGIKIKLPNYLYTID